MNNSLNSTHYSHFTLAGYIDLRFFKYLVFFIVLLYYMLIIVSNLLLIVVICMNRTLHEPMYMFLCSLFVNELYGATGLFPFLLTQVLSDIHTVPRSFCFVQVFCLYSYGTIEFLNLAVMSYDRYLAICFPLQYNTKMTLKKVATLTASTWFPAVFFTSIMVILSSSLQLCGNIINKVCCDNYHISKLSCGDITANSIYGLFATSITIFGPLTLILFTYARIFKVCFSGSKQTRQKALSTCSPHLASLINFSCGAFVEVVQSRFDMSNVPNIVRVILSLYFIICQPLLNPLMYGLKLSKVRHFCKTLFFSGA